MREYHVTESQNVYGMGNQLMMADSNESQKEGGSELKMNSRTVWTPELHGKLIEAVSVVGKSN